MANIKILDLNGLKTVFGIVDTKIADALPKKVSELTNDANYQTDTEVSTAITTALGSVYTKAEVDKAVEDKAKEVVGQIVDEAPESFDTLKEISDYIDAHQEVVDGLNAAIGAKANKADVYTKEEVEGKIADIDLTPYETKENAANTYQPIGDYLTEHQDLSAYAKTADFVAFTADEIRNAATTE